MVHRLWFSWMSMLVLLMLTLFGCAQDGAPKGGEGGNRGGRGGAQRPGVNVHTAQVQRMPIQRSVDLSGTLVSPDQARVSNEVAGPVVDVLVEIGQDVRVGQELVRLETTELKLALERAESALRQTEAQLGIEASLGSQVPPDDQIASIRTAVANRDDARAQFTRAQELFGKGLSSKADFDTAQVRVRVTEALYQAAVEDVQSLKASLQDRRAAYELAKKKLADAVIRAPVPGAVAERTVQRGEYIRENTPVVTIVRMNPLKLRTGVQEKYANLIRANQPVAFMVEPYPDEMFHGKIAYISPSVDQATRTFIVEILVDNPAQKLKPGFFAKGDILIGRDENVMAVPEETVSILAGVSSVYVIEGGVVKQTTVQLGQHEGKFVEIVSGLKGDETLAASNLNELVSGMRIGAPGDEEGGPGEFSGRGAGNGGESAGKSGGRSGRRGGEEGKGNAQ
jgi:RND family efflux transporter MFP subunit